MNNSNNNRTSFVMNEKFYMKIGSSWTLDLLYIVLISPLGFIGFILNLICFSVLIKMKIKSNKRIKIRLYDYLKIYSLNCSFICLIMGFLFMTYSPRFYSHTLSNVSKFFRCRIFGYGMLSLYFVNNL